MSVPCGALAIDRTGAITQKLAPAFLTSGNRFQAPSLNLAYDKRQLSGAHWMRDVNRGAGVFSCSSWLAADFPKPFSEVMSRSRVIAHIGSAVGDIGGEAGAVGITCHACTTARGAKARRECRRAGIARRATQSRGRIGEVRAWGARRGCRRAGIVSGATQTRGRIGEVRAWGARQGCRRAGIVSGATQARGRIGEVRAWGARQGC
jgi:hypothetical protein